MKIICHQKNDLTQAARALLQAYPEARVFAFYGNMGAGKTTFIKVICSLLGVHDIVQSPSFSIINEYKTCSGEPVFHFDFYRIRKIEEVFDIGYEEYLFSGSFCFLEWPELITGLLPEETVKIQIEEDLATGFRTLEF